MKMAAMESEGDARPPECRVSKLTNNGELKMGFLSNMKVPEGTAVKINQENQENRRLLARGRPAKKQMVQILAVKEDMDENDNEVLQPLMTDWEL